MQYACMIYAVAYSVWLSVRDYEMLVAYIQQGCQMTDEMRKVKVAIFDHYLTISKEQYKIGKGDIEG